MLLYIIYFLLAPLLWILILFSSLFQPKIRENYFSFYKRINIIKKSVHHANNKKKILLFHAASAGEYEQLKPLLRLINRNKYFIIQSFTSSTIYHKEKKSLLFDISCYHPFDLPWLSLYFFLSLKPQKYIITRHDIWPGHIVIASLLKISIYYINANIHKNSIWLKWYCKPLSHYIFHKFKRTIVPSKEIANNLYELDILKDNIMICNDSRFDQVQYRKDKGENKHILSNLASNNYTTIFGSIDLQDEKIIFESLKLLYPLGTTDLINKKNRLIFAPHETDSNTINRLTKKLNDLSFKYCKYSEYSLHHNNDDVVIIDSVGILADLYRYVNKAYIGGGFSRGVHSVIEPAIYNCSIGHGPNIEMLEEAKLLVNNHCSRIISNYHDMNNFLFSEDINKTCDLFKKPSSETILNHILS